MQVAGRREREKEGRGRERERERESGKDGSTSQDGSSSCHTCMANVHDGHQSILPLRPHP